MITKLTTIKFKSTRPPREKVEATRKKKEEANFPGEQKDGMV